MLRSGYIVSALFLSTFLSLNAQPSCPPVNFVGASLFQTFGNGQVSGLLRQPDGSYSFNTYAFTSGLGFSNSAVGIGAKLSSTPNFEQAFSCQGAKRTFKPSSAALAPGTGSRNPAAATLTGNRVIGTGSYTYNGNRAITMSFDQSGNMTSSTQFAVTTNAVHYYYADVNGDNKQDLLITKFGNGSTDPGGVEVRLGNADGTTGNPTTVLAGNGAEGMAVADINKDGKLDLVVGNYNSNNVSVIRGNGDGTFGTAVSYPVGASAFFVAVGDLTGDGNPDIVYSTQTSSQQGTSGTVGYLPNKGDSTFQAAVSLISNFPASSVALGDLNRDGKIDAVAIHKDYGAVIVGLGNGTGGFTNSNTYQGVTGTASILDFNGDSYPDVLIGAGNADAITANVNTQSGGTPFSNAVLFGDGTGMLSGAPIFATTSLPSSIAVGLFDGDPNIDIAVGANGGVTIVRGQGGGLFQSGTQLNLSGVQVTGVAAGNFDSNPGTDLAVADATGRVSLFFSSSNGLFASGPTYQAGTRVAAADLNGDGRVDLLAGGPSGVAPLLNSGGGVFQLQAALSTSAATDVAVGDVNGDGRPDAIWLTSAGLLVATNKGGSFNAASSYTMEGGLYLATGDIDRDGALDVVATGVSGGGHYRVFLGGQTTLRSAPRGFLSANPTGIALGDFNNDGVADLAISECCGEAMNNYLLGNGDGSFSGETPIWGGSAHRAIWAGDLNGDKKTDLITADGTSQNGYATVLINAAPSLSLINAASLTSGSFAPDSFVTVKGSGLASGSAAAGLVSSSNPYGPSLGGTTVKVKDATGTERAATLHYVSATQVNFVLPSGTANGAATVTITAADGTTSTGQMTVASVGPGLFMFGGTTLAAANVIRVRNGVTTVENVYAVSGANLVAAPIDLGPTDDVVALVLYGTGWRGRTNLANVTLTVGGVAIPVDYAGAQGQYPALDQLNILLPRSLAGRGNVDVRLTVDGQVANVATISIK